MLIQRKNLNKKIVLARSFFKTHGYLIIKNTFKKSLLKEIEKTIIYSLNKYIKLDLKKIISLDDPYFHTKLISLRKKSSKKFSLFFDTIQTSSSCFRFWNSNEILSVIEKISKTKHHFLSTNDILTRFDSPLDRKNQLEWHQDSAYFRQNSDNRNAINCWTTFINCKFEMGPLEFIDKSHKLGMLNYKKKRIVNFGSLIRGIDNKYIENSKVKQFELNVGDLLLLNMDTIHRSGNNISKKFRISGLCRYHKILTKCFNPGLNVYRYSNKKLNDKVHN